MAQQIPVSSGARADRGARDDAGARPAPSPFSPGRDPAGSSRGRDARRAPQPGVRPVTGLHELESPPDLAYQRLGIVNVVFCGLPGAGDRRWILVDAGIPGTAGLIRRAAAHRFGDDARPFAIVLTHGHFDHVGALRTLAEEWDAPIYAHALELPHLDGRTPYPPPNPAAGGLMSFLSPLFPRGPIDVRPWLSPLPDDGTVPGMPRWRWLHTPGHTRGHVSLWRDTDRTLIAGDAFITTAQESAYAALTQRIELHGPPQYFTEDWVAAADSVRALARLSPALAVTGHGRPLRGIPLQTALHHLAEEFEEVAVPDRG